MTSQPVLAALDHLAVPAIKNAEDFSNAFLDIQDGCEKLAPDIATPAEADAIIKFLKYVIHPEFDKYEWPSMIAMRIYDAVSRKSILGHQRQQLMRSSLQDFLVKSVHRLKDPVQYVVALKKYNSAGVGSRLLFDKKTLIYESIFKLSVANLSIKLFAIDQLGSKAADIKTVAININAYAKPITGYRTTLAKDSALSGEFEMARRRIEETLALEYWYSNGEAVYLTNWMLKQVFISTLGGGLKGNLLRCMKRIP